MNVPLLTVCLITYNHRKDIRQAIDSVLMQKVDFSWELIIADDFSTDGTREILLDYENLYPGIIKLILQEKNVGPHKNWMDLITFPKSKYIAYFEGDDYWTDPNKLQKQVDFLESNPDYGMVCTDYHKYYQRENRYKKNCFKVPKYKDTVGFDDYILDRSTIGTATTIFRTAIINQYFNEIPANVRSTWNVGDTPLWLYISLKHKIKVLPDVTAVYRILDSSACHYETPEERYNFYKKGFEVPNYFIENFNVKTDTVLEVKRKYLRMELNYYYELINYEKAKKKFEEINMVTKPSAREYLLLFGSYNQITNKITSLIFFFNSRMI